MRRFSAQLVLMYPSGTEDGFSNAKNVVLIKNEDVDLSIKNNNDIPPMTEKEQWDMRIYLALSHEDNGKCHIYGDDGELQCNNFQRHGRTMDFRREPISALLETIQLTRLKELGVLNA